MTPALADANNGNWQTAHRWSRLLSGAYRVRLAAQWSNHDDALMIALHARRSAHSVVSWRERYPGRPLVLVLTGTDLYRDIACDADAQRSLELADKLVVLNALGARALPAHLQDKAHVVLQSCSARVAVGKSPNYLRALMVGHLRSEKDPQTYFEAARLLAHDANIHFDHIGAALEPDLGQQAQALHAACPNYRWLGSLSHDATRRRIQRAHVLVHPSRMEGGAHVVIEAVRSGTPVLASHIDGNVGLLGAGYAGYFAAGNAAELSVKLVELHLHRGSLAQLAQQAQACSVQFDAENEARSLQSLLAPLI